MKRRVTYCAHAIRTPNTKYGAQLLNKCASYRAALLTVSRATAGFADAMEICSGYVYIVLRELNLILDRWKIEGRKL